jgi:diadenosine tetraphosphate (Ap4A) HIT family hydrolase
MAATPSSERLSADCPLCVGEGGTTIWRDDRLRVVLPDEPAFPGFTRVVWREHVAEMTDLAPPDRLHLMSVVMAVEAAQRETLGPDKINLASLGNLVPHLHWHVIPRWRDDSHFPEPIWGKAVTGREAAVLARRAAVRERLPAYLELLRALPA